MICTTTSGVGDTNGPTRPNPERVSTTRAGVTDTKLLSTPVEARTTPRPPAPSDTATAAPIAAHRERRTPDMTGLRSQHPT